VKLFLKRPPEMKNILKEFFEHILNNPAEDLDLKDRAAYFFRAMSANMEEFSEAFNKYEKEKLDAFIEDEEESSNQDGLNFNTLSIIYNK
jgi:AP-4 complex subunit beta-1